MTQAGEEALGVQQSSTVDKQLRLIKFVVAQDDGTWKTVVVEPAVLIDPVTSNTVTPMSASQADTMITLLRDLKELLIALREEIT